MREKKLTQMKIEQISICICMKYFQQIESIKNRMRYAKLLQNKIRKVVT